MAVRQVSLERGAHLEPDWSHPMLAGFQPVGWYVPGAPGWIPVGDVRRGMWARGGTLTTDGSAATNAPRVYRAESLSGDYTVLLAFVPANTTDANRVLWHQGSSATDTTLAASARGWGFEQHNATIGFISRSTVRFSSGSVLTAGKCSVVSIHTSGNGPIDLAHIDGSDSIGSYSNGAAVQVYTHIMGGDAGGSSAGLLWAIWGRLGGTTAQRSAWHKAATAYFQRFPLDLFRPSTITVPVSAAGGGDVSVNLTGASSTLSAGSLSSAVAQSVSGAVVTLSTGTLVSAVEQALSGAVSTFSAGTITAAAAYTLAGQAATAAAGTIIPAVEQPLTGAAITSAQGSISTSAGGDVSVNLSGQALTASHGTLAGTVDYNLSGVAVTAAAGTLDVSVAQVLSGLSIASAAGTITHTGGDSATYSILPPYITVYFWRRTA